MQKFFARFLIVCSALAIAACSKTLDIKQEKQVAFRKEKQVKADVTQAQQAAERALEKIIRRSETSESTRIWRDGNELQTAWLYAMSNDKYATIDFNGVPERKQLQAKRKYLVAVEESVAGSLVKVAIEEEIEQLDKTSGKRVGWKEFPADTDKYDEFFQYLRDSLRQL